MRAMAHEGGLSTDRATMDKQMVGHPRSAGMCHQRNLLPAWVQALRCCPTVINYRLTPPNVQELFALFKKLETNFLICMEEICIWRYFGKMQYQ